MKKVLEKVLASLAQRIINKYKPKIVGITGSMGKTSAKEAVYAVLKSKFNTRKNIKNYNNELGVPLSIIGHESGGRSLIKWLMVFLKAFRTIFLTDENYPEVLVLEMGADKPGDIEYLVKCFPCDVGVVTRVGPAHLEAFKTVENIAKEKQKIVTLLDKDKLAVLNYDDELVKVMAEKVKCDVMYFGYDENADIYSIDLKHHGEGLGIKGIGFKIAKGGSAVPVLLPGVVGEHQINSALIAATVGLGMGMNLLEITQALKEYKAPRGRMSLVTGKSCLIIDDTYNSSPKAAFAAVEAVSKLNIDQVARKVAVMGDMLELGDMNDEAHVELGKKIAEAGFDLLIVAGLNKELTAKGAKENGLENILKFDDSVKVASEIENIIKQNDLVLVKGSQGSRMERVVKVLMKDSDRAGELLVRQDKSWK
jgi:UDP-N-acetylmuramoyl-tripeptide--D-alanyl-D-alanine ligase